MRPPTPTLLPTPTLADTPGAILLYYTQSGDTLSAVATRFGVTIADIGRPTPVPELAILAPGVLLLIPDRLGPTTPAEKLIPDSELVFSANASAFDAAAFAEQASGYLSRYMDFVVDRDRSGAEVIHRVALENSINPRLLLALLEYRSGWVFSDTPDPATLEYPMGHFNRRDPRLYHQLTWAANLLNIGYYGWRAGTLTDLNFADGSSMRLAPDLNAGTVALLYFFAQYLSGEDWAAATSPAGFPALYREMFGDPFQRAVDPLLPPGLSQPELDLPFLPGRVWSMTGGPHGPWERDGAWAALDFAPPSIERGCVRSDEWVVAAAAGLVVRSGDGVVVLDLDGDGREQTGWVLFYLHLADRSRAPLGKTVERGDLIGHPSCEGGFATGTHVHFARKFNGEWIAADGPIPFNLGGWVAHNGPRAYQGSLTNGPLLVIACTCSSSATQISH